MKVDRFIATLFGGFGVRLVKMLKLHMGFQSTDPFECAKIEETDIIDKDLGRGNGCWQRKSKGVSMQA